MSGAIQRVAIVGSSGQLGHDLVDAFQDVQVFGLAHEDVSIEDAASVERSLDQAAPQVLINTAAYHHVARCETHPREALLINAIGVANLAHACARRGIIFATLSTDYVFDGLKGSPYTEWDEPRPLSVYGLSKLAGEMLAIGATPAHYVFRTSGLFGKLGSKSKGYTFIDKILQQARDGSPMSVVTDMIFSPSYTKHVARTIRAVIERGPFGLYHVTNSGSCTWYEFAAQAVAASGMQAEITPMESAQWNDGVRRPANSALAHEALHAAGIHELPHWKDAVAEYIAERGVRQVGR